MAISAKAVKKLGTIFLGEFVTIFLKDMNVVTVSEDQQEIKVTAMAEGIVVDIDVDYFYLGLPDGEITRVISHDLAQMVEIQFTGDEFMSQDMPFDEDVH